MNRQMRLSATSLLLSVMPSLPAVPAPAQPLSSEIYFVVNGTLSVTSPFVDIELWASFQHVPGTAEIFLGTSGKITAIEDFILTGWAAPSGQLASVMGGGNEYMYLGGQIYFPPMFPGILDNPFLLFTASITSQDLTTKRTIDISTATFLFTVASFPAGISTNLPLSSVTEGSAKIHVVPSPTPLALLCTASLVTGRRRRSRMTLRDR